MDSARIDEILGDINWNIIRSYYSAIKKREEADLDKLIIWEKIILRRRMQFLVKSSEDKLFCANWVIRCTRQIVNKRSNPVKLQVQFIPISESVSLLGEDLPMKSKGKDPEWESLHTLLHHYTNNEEYELCQIIKNRLNEIIEEKRIYEKLR